MLNISVAPLTGEQETISSHREWLQMNDVKSKTSQFEIVAQL